MKKVIIDLIDDILPVLDKFYTDLTNIIYANHEGQEEHFDKLCKVEQLAIYGVFVSTKTLLDILYEYKNWFNE